MRRWTYRGIEEEVGACLDCLRGARVALEQKSFWKFVTEDDKWRRRKPSRVRTSLVIALLARWNRHL
jgi:hypothetical protein